MRTTLQKGFTLVELLVVVAIIGLLAGIATVSVNSTRVRARDARRIADVKQMQNALELYNNANAGIYPAKTAADITLGDADNDVIDSSAAGIVGTPTAGADIFLNIVPRDPKTGQNYTYKTCGAAAAGQAAARSCVAYAIAFTTEASTSLGAAGKYCASPTGISLGPTQGNADGGCTSTTAP